MLTRIRTWTRPERLRAIGWLVLGSGAVASIAFYAIAARAADQALTDANALGYTKAMRHQMGVMMGHFGLTLMQWNDALTSPLGEALAVAACAALVAAYFFRVAWVLDHDADR